MTNLNYFFVKLETNSGKAIVEVDLIDKSISGVIIVFSGFISINVALFCLA
jgi:hypothetical protein